MQSQKINYSGAVIWTAFLMQYDDEYNKTRPKRYNYILHYA